MSPILNSIPLASPSQPNIPFYRELSSWLVNLVCQRPVFGSGSAQQIEQSVYLLSDANNIDSINNTPDDRTVEQLLEYAKQKLRTPQMPHFIRVTVYLRFCCLAIQKSLSEEHQALVSNFYHDLLQWLWECEPNWWEQCFITDTHSIASKNIQIQDLLQPLEEFVSQFSEG
ncbi:MAG: hypothetical protein HC827_16615 [Cyanobacteria bacterium RM1_2_2]|nr:hypothetical protein [Cyanobacteria bacterium RM1_2_2]